MNKQTNKHDNWLGFEPTENMTMIIKRRNEISNYLWKIDLIILCALWSRNISMAFSFIQQQNIDSWTVKQVWKNVRRVLFNLNVMWRKMKKDRNETTTSYHDNDNDKKYTNIATHLFHYRPVMVWSKLDEFHSGFLSDYHAQ